MILLDFSPISIAAASVLPDEELNIDSARHHIISSLLNRRKQFRNYGEMTIVLDSGNYWRYDLYPLYKGDRNNTREQSKFDWKKFFELQKTIIDEICDVLPYRFVRIPRCEADDIIGWTALNAKEPTVIISPDQDFKQCMRNSNVRLFSNIKKKFVPDETLEEINYNLHKKIMKGDSGDYINNVMTPLMEHSKRQHPVTEKIILYTYQNGLSEDLKERYEENQKLIDFRFIPDEYKQKIEEEMSKPIVGSKGKTFNYLMEKMMKSKTAGNWLRSIDDF